MAECDHFYDLDLGTLNDELPLWRCINCGKTKRMEIPIINLDDIQKAKE